MMMMIMIIIIILQIYLAFRGEVHWFWNKWDIIILFYSVAVHWKLW